MWTLRDGLHIFGRGYRDRCIVQTKLTPLNGKASLAETLFQKLFGKRYFLPDPGISGRILGFPGNPGKSWEILGNPGNPGNPEISDDF